MMKNTARARACDPTSEQYLWKRKYMKERGCTRQAAHYAYHRAFTEHPMRFSSLCIPDDLYQMAKERAKKDGIPLSILVRRSMETYIMYTSPAPEKVDLMEDRLFTSRESFATPIETILEAIEKR